MSLRDDCIHVLEWYCGHQAGEALDAVLGVLEQQADEWADYGATAHPQVREHRAVVARRLLAVLGEPSE